MSATPHGSVAPLGAWKMAVPSITDRAATESAEVSDFCHCSGAWRRGTRGDDGTVEGLKKGIDSIALSMLTYI